MAPSSLGEDLPAPTEAGNTDIGDPGSWIQEGDSPELAEALRNLANATAEAKESDFDQSPLEALNNARAVLRKMHGVSQRVYFVYPMPEGDIAIDAPGGFGESAILYCSAGGRVKCHVNRQGTRQFKEYPGTDSLPDTFLRRTLAHMEDDKWREK